MSSLKQIKLTQYMTNQKSTTSSIARSIAALNNDLSAGLEHQAYARKTLMMLLMLNYWRL